MLNKITTSDCRIELRYIESNSVDMILTDPPYYLDGLDEGFEKGATNSKRQTGSVGGLPVGMKFDKEQGLKLQLFMGSISLLLYRILKPGGFFICFSQPRLAGRMSVAIEDAGFEIRDTIAWHFTKKAQAKAFSLAHFIDGLNVDQATQDKLKEDCKIWKTPQLKPAFETAILAQKPVQYSYLYNWNKYGVGLMNTTEFLNDKFPSNVMLVEKEEKDDYNKHLTVKPVALLEHQIRLFSQENQIILDPFLGSGSTAVAAIKCNRRFIGIEINPEFADIARRRVAECQ